jgi:diguanylate cyclase (GGDEF)-like protein/PAS domain S-box-containing protein
VNTLILDLRPAERRCRTSGLSLGVRHLAAASSLILLLLALPQGAQAGVSSGAAASASGMPSQAANLVLLGLLVLGLAAVTGAAHWCHRQRRDLRSELERERRWSCAMDQSGLAVWDWDVQAGRIWFSRGWQQLTGGQSEVGLPTERLNRIPVADQERLAHQMQMLLDGTESHFASEHILKTDDGRERWVVERVQTLARDAQGRATRLVALVEDISERRIRMATMERLASHDPLTGLPNRALLHDRLQQALTRANRKNCMVAVIYLDVDHFKHINDSLGHRVGDQVLSALAHALQHWLRKMDTLSRRGGDEFVLLLPELDNAAQAGRVCEKLMLRLRDPLPIEGGEVSVSMSMGVAMYPTDARDGETLLQLADMALYRSKSAGRRCVSFYETELNRTVQQSVDLESKMRSALAGGHFAMWYQPQFDLRSGELFGVEALMRWLDEDGNLRMPAEFIPLAEKFGHIHELGSWSFRESCRELQALQPRLARPISVSVNVSPAQFRRPGLAAQVRQALEETGWPADQLVVEASERVVMENIEVSQHTLNALEEVGVRLAIDNFGIAYSSVAVLKRCRLHHLKVDASLVRELGRGGDHDIIVQSIVQLGHSLGVKVLAEGVETAYQARVLRMQGCDLAQGHFFSPAVPKEHLWQLAELDRLSQTQQLMQAAAN